jgi:DNA-binding NarL/FixJ family response regulator
MLSMHDESLYTERALRAGARGFLMKEEAPQTLLTAIRKVLAGGVYVSEKMGANLLQGMAGGKRVGVELPMDCLTDRELEIFHQIGAGKTMKDIAEGLFLSVKTVESHREHIKDKLNIKTSAELLRFATQNAGHGGRAQLSLHVSVRLPRYGNLQVTHTRIGETPNLPINAP